MEPSRRIILRTAIVWCVMGGIMLGGFTMDGQAQQSSSVGNARVNTASSAILPKDVYSGSGFRIPLPKREELDRRDGLAGERLPTHVKRGGHQGASLHIQQVP
jgi:hypothetical protein